MHHPKVSEVHHLGPVSSEEEDGTSGQRGTSTTPLNIETEVMNFVALDTRSELSSPRCL